MKLEKTKAALQSALESAGARLVFDKGEDDGKPIDLSTLHWICGALSASFRMDYEEKEKSKKSGASVTVMKK